MVFEEKHYWRRAAERSRLERIRNDRIGEIMGVKQTIVEEAEMVQTRLMNNHKKTPKANIRLGTCGKKTETFYR